MSSPTGTQCAFATAPGVLCGSKASGQDKICGGCQLTHAVYLSESAIQAGSESLRQLVEEIRGEREAQARQNNTLTCVSESFFDVPARELTTDYLGFIPSSRRCAHVAYDTHLCNDCMYRAKDAGVADGRVVKNRCVMSDVRFSQCGFKDLWAPAENCQRVTEEDAICDACYNSITSSFKDDEPDKFHQYFNSETRCIRDDLPPLEIPVIHQPTSDLTPQPCPFARAEFYGCNGERRVIKMGDEKKGNVKMELEPYCAQCQEEHPYKIWIHYDKDRGVESACLTRMRQKRALAPLGMFVCASQSPNLWRHHDLATFTPPDFDCPYTDGWNKFCEQCRPIAQALDLCLDNGIAQFKCPMSDPIYVDYPFRQERWKAVPQCEAVVGSEDYLCKPCWDNIIFEYTQLLDDARRVDRWKMGQCFEGHGALKKKRGRVAPEPGTPLVMQIRAPSPSEALFF
ncbi:hypothetical protein P280DRAFT_527735 [Massarina eburnea CBS 473.64]|uniref:Uncharacterized protein n=1 Tax=Massarina eburnea CBS 473.64 TaxID=1395130 RepID=A0A6A6RWT7_9PLEO|nr:hypothetical protein P280DRAFT_527735 [Massarina eburnea CBS 473.64]